jgi:hypothetical protein
MIPRTLPETSDKVARYLKSKSQRRAAASAVTTFLAAASMRAIVCSATESRFASGVLTTAMPRAVASETSMALTPTPCDPTTRRAGAAAMAAAVRPALRVITAVASPISLAIVAMSAAEAIRGESPALRRSSRPTGWIG